MGFGVEFPGTGYGMKTEYESSDHYGGGGSSMQMMRPGHHSPSHMHSSESYHAHGNGGSYGHNMHHSSVGSHGHSMQHSSAGFHGHGPSQPYGYGGMQSYGSHGMPHSGHQSYHMQNSGPGHMADMSYEHGSFDHGVARGYNYDGGYKMQNGGYGAEYKKKGI